MRSQPGLGLILGARVLSEFDDNPTLLTDADPALPCPGPDHPRLGTRTRQGWVSHAYALLSTS